MNFEIIDLGLIDYYRAWQKQKEIFTQVKNRQIPSALILCQHYPVITLGRLANKKNILVSEQELKNKGIAIQEIERGGDVTYHGPGQLTAYPIFNLNYFKKDIHWFLRAIEEVMINLLSDFGIRGTRFEGFTGVWINQQKIASIGIAIKSWITFHGLSLNVKKNDLANFQLIRPCGMDVEMTSLENVLCQEIEISSLKDKLIDNFRRV